MNPAIKLLLVFLIAFEISFITNITLNVVIIVACLAYLIWKRVNIKTVATFCLIALLPALGIFFSQFYYGDGLIMGTALFIRLYAYVLLGLSFSLTTYMVDLANSLEQNAHVPAKFVYGVLAAINLVPRLQYEIKVIRANGNMRGKVLHPWMPTLYFKALIVAIGWSNDLAQAMESQGFVENQPRTFFKISKIHPKDWIILLATLIIVQLIIFIH
ncbi:energy-coupling factor transporter transmembrane protein EcfT [Fructilactobacillus sanfranciscensis]|uniref:energy-coupling factor transporter transmembrane component T family protein n=1 Tax=Fructilactobacillus sanfranciscensis TaxID=1625 RepID=UPI0013CFFA66|nr:energy-coupling factor transporter transmembrane component T [Fructilactobacillus sanfranciscensis]NDR98301.1 energy-coupling factor transporter transmembrane protein EcfT [Fructilactobacillus sanfranciscensis]